MTIDPRFAEHLTIFVDVVRAGSFSSAARRRGLTPSAIARQIDSLEQSVGVALFIRSTRALALTDAGDRLFERAQRLLDDLADTHAEIAAFDGAVTGTFRLACFPTFGKRYVIPAMAAVMRDHPQLRVELDLTERLADPVLERLDAVIRIGSLADSTLIATRLAGQKRLLVAAPGYLDAHPGPATCGGLADHQLIDKIHGADLLGWSDVLGHPVAERDEPGAVFRCDDFEAMRQAAVERMGVALLPDWVCGPDVQAGALVRLPLDDAVWNNADSGIYLLRALAQPSAKFRVVSSALRAVIGSPPVWQS